jgi:hypothetical protein
MVENLLHQLQVFHSQDALHESDKNFGTFAGGIRKNFPFLP